MRFSPALLSALIAAPVLAEPPKVVVDIAPVHALVSQVMQGVGEPQLLLDQTANPHSVQLKPSQVRMLDGADLLVWVGPELSPWLDRIVEAQAGEAMALTALSETRLRMFGGAGDAGDAAHADHDHDHDDDHDHEAHEEHDDHAHEDDAHDEHGHQGEEHVGEDHVAEEHDGEDHDGHDHDGVDPHVWLTTENARAWLGVFAETLAAHDPGNAAIYRGNASEAIAGIDALDARIETRLAAHQGAEIVTFHESFGYFAARFGIGVVGSVRPGDASAPSAAAMETLRALVEEHGVVCAFAEPAFDPGLLDAIAGGTGLRIGMLDPNGALQPVGPGHYAATLTAAAEAIAACLEGA